MHTFLNLPFAFFFSPPFTLHENIRYEFEIIGEIIMSVNKYLQEIAKRKKRGNGFKPAPSISLWN